MCKPTGTSFFSYVFDCCFVLFVLFRRNVSRNFSKIATSISPPEKNVWYIEEAPGHAKVFGSKFARNWTRKALAINLPAPTSLSDQLCLGPDWVCVIFILINKYSHPFTSSANQIIRILLLSVNVLVLIMIKGCQPLCIVVCVLHIKLAFPPIYIQLCSIISQ